MGRTDWSGPRSRDPDTLRPPGDHGPEGADVISYAAPYGRVVIAVFGEIDRATAAHMRWAITGALAGEPVPRAIVLDLTGVTSLDPIGVHTLVVGYLACARVGVPVSLHSD